MNEYDVAAMAIAMLGAGLITTAVMGKFRKAHIRIGSLLIGSCCVVFGLSHFFQSNLYSGSPSYASEAEFLADQERHSFVSIGRFDTSWPATYVDEITGSGKITFVRQNGTPHEYTGFDGYQLKVVRLRDQAGREPIMVLRSKSKR